MTAPLVSVCIPAYRQTRYLRRALDSLRVQTFQNFEIVLTDDSPDDEVETFLTHYHFGLQLRYFRNARPLGTPENWNEAVRQSKGEWIKILHHDDWFSTPESLEKLVTALNAHPGADFAFCASINTFADTDRVRDIHCPTPEQIERLHQHPEDLFAANRIGAPSATMYRRRAGLEYDSRLKYAVDTDFYIRFLRQNPAFVFVNEPLISIGLNEGQVTQRVSTDGPLLLFEYAYVYEKLGLDARQNRSIARFWWEFFYRFGIRSLEQFRSAGFKGNVGPELRGLMRLAPLAGLLEGYLSLKKRLFRRSFCL